MPPTVERAKRPNDNLDRHGVKEILRSFFRIVIHLTVLLVAAGQARWFNAWFYFLLCLVLLVIHFSVLFKMNPKLINERGKGHDNTKTFDKIVYALWIPLTLLTLIVAGLDAVRYEWSHMSTRGIYLGAVLLVPAFFFGLWAMAVNRHFETTVRIQNDRDHQVCAAGPYRFVRHPGYASLIVTSLGTPFLLGSWWSLVPLGIIVLLFGVRTALEDRTLQAGLPGYRVYATKTPYRLFPFVW